MIPFERLDLSKKAAYDAFLRHAAHRGCTFSFANLYLWGRQYAARIGEHLVFFSHFGGKTMYPYPAGPGEAKPAIDAIMDDARKRGIPFRLTSLTARDRQDLERWYPGQFRFHCGRDSHDYVYDIHDLAELRGRKYQQKRNHVNRFLQDHPDASVRPLDDDTLADAQALANRWYQRRGPEEDAQMELAALSRAFRNYRGLGMEGLVLYVGSQVVAMTMGSFLSDDTIDVHFEKADTDYPGAYAVINRAFARYIREKYPQVRYLDREEDMGLEGLRKAKLSYHPHHMVEKCWAHLVTEESDDY